MKEKTAFPERSLPFKGRAGVGMGYYRERNISLFVFFVRRQMA